MGRPSRFRDGTRFKSYAGYAPRASETGETDRKGQPMSKAGPSLLRATLFRAADTARRQDPQLARIYHQQMTERGATHLKACCVVAGHLAERAWAVLNRGAPYVICDNSGNPVTAEEVLHPARGARVLPLHPGGLDALLEEPGLIHHQHAISRAQMPGRIRPDIITDPNQRPRPPHSAAAASHPACHHPRPPPASTRSYWPAALTRPAHTPVPATWAHLRAHPHRRHRAANFRRCGYASSEASRAALNGGFLGNALRSRDLTPPSRRS